MSVGLTRTHRAARPAPQGGFPRGTHRVRLGVRALVGEIWENPDGEQEGGTDGRRPASLPPWQTPRKVSVAPSDAPGIVLCGARRPHGPPAPPPMPSVMDEVRSGLFSLAPCGLAGSSGLGTGPPGGRGGQLWKHQEPASIRVLQGPGYGGRWLRSQHAEDLQGVGRVVGGAVGGALPSAPKRVASVPSPACCLMSPRSHSEHAALLCVMTMTLVALYS